MTCSSAQLVDWKTRNQQLKERLAKAIDGHTSQEMLRQPKPGVWSPAQVIEHMVLANRKYLPLMDAGLQSARPVTGDPHITHTFFGRQIIKACSPTTNYPAPRTLHPGPQPNLPKALDEWKEQQNRMTQLIERAEGRDLCGTRVRNPFFRFMTMSLADCFEILTMHTERHVGQIEQRVGAGRC